MCEEALPVARISVMLLERTPVEVIDDARLLLLVYEFTQVLAFNFFKFVNSI